MTDAKIETEIGQEKEALSLAWNSCMVNKLATYESITDMQLANELKNNGFTDASVSKSGNKFKVTFSSGNVYTIKNDGTIQEYEKIEPTAIYAKLYTDGTLILSSTNYTDETLGEYTDYGEVSSKTNYYQQTNGEPILIGEYPGWIDEKVYMPNNTKIKKVIVYDKISPQNTAYWFCGCSNLTTIEGIENLDTSNVTDMNSMFYYCFVLNGLNVSNWDTSQVTNMKNLFTYCYELTEMDVSGWDTGNVTNMERMFYSAANIDVLDVSGWDTSKVTNMNSMFSGLGKVKILDVSNWNTSNVTSMYCMFEYCRGVKKLDIDNWDTSKVTSMNAMFEDCSSLTSLDFSKFNTINVTGMVSMFKGCNNLSKLDVSGFNTEKVTYMSQMFSNCSNLTELNLSTFNTKKIDTSNINGLVKMFENVTAKIIVGSNWNSAMTESATSYNGTFEKHN